MEGRPSPAPEPPVARYAGMLPVAGGHVIAWQEFGVPDGVCALVLHGGPGSALTPGLVRFFDLQHWRVIGFDQRGCGRSQPRGATRNNETDRLLEDIESLRQHLNVRRWLVVGGSWGGTLGLVYASRHPRSVSALLLRALFVPHADELRWFFQEARGLAPGPWQQLSSLAPREVRADLLPWLASVFAAPEHPAQEAAALAWLAWEQALAGAAAGAPADLPAVIDRYRVQCHYLVHGCWLADRSLQDAARQLSGVPVAFLHGELDAVCRPAAARKVQASIPGSRFSEIPGAGHDPFHPAMEQAMRQALQDLANACAHGT